jgi:hypothetical protein
MGAHFNRFYHGQDGLSRTAPWSYVIYHSTVAQAIDQNTDSASSVGLHSASVRPMGLRLSPDILLPGQLKRSVHEGRADRFDALVGHFLEKYKQGLAGVDAPGGVRAPLFGDHLAARRSIGLAPELAEMLTAEQLAWQLASTCGSEDHPDQSETSFKLAAHLLNHPVHPAKLVTIMDGGLLPDATGLGYDTHQTHVPIASTNMVHFFKRFVERINQPGEDDPTKLDLDKNLVVVNTEFGRSPTPEFTPANPTGSGLDHWPWGYVSVVFGGYVDEARRGVVGSIDAAGYATEYMTPTEHRAAILLASGIWPFAAESYRVADVRGAENELHAAQILREKYLGYSL